MMQGEFSEIDLCRVDLNLLLVLSALMRERSVTRAAGRLFMGPSAVSMALRRLRALFDDELFVRTRGGMEPTARALEAYARLEPSLQQIHAAVFEAPRFDPRHSARVIRFASPDDLEVALLPRLVDRLAREAPGMTLIVRPSDFRIVPGLLDSGEADLALTATPPGLERRHRHEPLHRDSFAALYVPERLGLRASAPALTLETYLAVPHVLMSPAGDTSGPIDRRLRELGLARRVEVVVARFSTVPHLLRAAPLIANMPAVAARHYAKAFDLALSPLPFASPRFEVSLVWHARGDGDPAIAWFKDLVRAAVAELAAPSTASRSDP